MRCCVSIAFVILLAQIAAIGTVLAGIPEPDAIVYGRGTNPIQPGSVVDARVGGVVLASSTLGSIPAAGDLYVLRIPLETPSGPTDPPTPGVVRIPVTVRLFLSSPDGTDVVDTGIDVAIDDRGLVVPDVDIPSDPDPDGDGVDGTNDNCPFVANALQTDADNDGSGDVCDTCTDVDEDGYGDPALSLSTCLGADNCVATRNGSQNDSDADGVGDACESNPILVVSSDPADKRDYSTVAEAEGAAQSAGTTIRVLAGLGPYAEGAVLNSNMVTRLVGVAGARAELTGSGSGPTVDVVSSSIAAPVVVQDLVINGDDGVRAQGPTRIINCEFNAIAGTAIDLVAVSPAKHALSDIAIRSGDTGIRTAADTDAVVERSSVSGLSTGLDIGGAMDLRSSLVADSLTGVLIRPGGNLQVRYSTIADNAIVGIENQGQVRISQSIVWDNPTDLMGVDCADVSLSDTLTPNCSAVNSNVSVLPGLQTDYHLFPNSPLIEFVAPSSFNGVPCLDLSGGPRARDFDGDGLAEVDLGAYEEGPVAPVPEVAGLLWLTPDDLEWTAVPSAVEYHVYRGGFETLGYDGAGECRDDLDAFRGDEFLTDVDTPVPGTGFFYLINVETDNGTEGTTGIGTCAERARLDVCSTAPMESGGATISTPPAWRTEPMDRTDGQSSWQ